MINTVSMQAGGSFLVNGEMSVPALPDDPSTPLANRHTRMVKKWIDAGNTPTPYVAPVPTYQELRQRAYPPIGDQLDALWKGGQSQADMKLIIDGVKATYPKV